MTGRADPSHYDRLGVDPRATTMQIRMAFRSLAKQAHPDMGGDPVAFRLLKEAHDCLVNPVRRKEYDQMLGARVAPAPVGSATRGWTEQRGDFTGNVEWPSYLRDIADAPWQAPDPTEDDSEDAGVGTARGPAQVVWWWQGSADRDPVAAGPLVILSGDRDLAACDIEAGHELWRADLGAPSSVAPVVVGETVVAASTGQDLQAFELGRGVLRWQLRLPVNVTGLGAVGNDDSPTVVVAVGNVLMGVDPMTGRRRWTTRPSGPASVLRAFGDLVVVHTDRATLDGIDTKKGRHRFALKNIPALQVPPVWAGGLVWVVSQGSRIVGLDPTNGTSVAALAPGLTVCGTAGTGPRSLLYATVAGPEEVLAIGHTGGVRWRAPLPSAALGPAVDDDFVYVLTGEQDFLTFDRTDGQLIAATHTEVRPVADPVAVPGRVLLRDADGTIWALAPPRPSGFR